jgi:membrane-bound lytic murein transglycosylase D
VADTASISLAADRPAQRRVAFHAGPKDTIASIAKRYKVSSAQVAQWNDLSASAKLTAGQALVVFVPHKAAAGARKSAPKPASATRSASSSSKQSAAPSPRKKAGAAPARQKH